MAILTLEIDNKGIYDNLIGVLKLMKGVTIVPNVKADDNARVARPAYAERYKDVSGIGGSWASEDFPTAEELQAMRKASHKAVEI